MNFLFIQPFSRIFYLFRYHRAPQFFYRLKKIFSSRFKWFYFKASPPLNSSQQLSIQNNLVKIEEYKEKHLPLLQVPCKIPLTFVPPPNNSDLFIQFEFYTHRHLLFVNHANESWKAIIDWIGEHSPENLGCHSPPWHPYVISKRIQYWVGLWVISPPQTNEAQTVILKSLHQQGVWLQANLEKDIKGNHLWENAVALTLLALFLDCPKSKTWFKSGTNLLRSILPVQILDSGEHYEKSPSYHWELNRGLAFLLPWLKNHPTEHEFVQFHLKKMDLFISRIAHPNGTLPFFNDSWLTQVPPNQNLFSGWVGDYFVARTDKMFFIFDAGNQGPNELPAHSHSDLLTFEFSAGKDVLIQNSGTFSYHTEERAFFRGTKSHNVLVADNLDYADMWGAFRMGYRGHITKKEHLTSPNGTWIWGAHNSYKRIQTPQVLRVWFVSTVHSFVCSLYFVKTHRSSPCLDEFIHLSPQTHIDPIVNKNKRYFKLRPASETHYWHLENLIPSNQATIETGTFSPKFYEKISTQFIKITNSSVQTNKKIQLVSAWVLGPESFSSKIALDMSFPIIKLSWEQDSQTFESTLSFPMP